MLTFKRVKRGKGIWLEVYRNGYGGNAYHKPFTSGLCYDLAHVEAVERKFKSWASMGWPYQVKDV